MSVSVVLPAKNEAPSLGAVLDAIVKEQPQAEIIVVNDGSSDDTASIAASRPNVRCINHPISLGNGAAIKSGARAATGDVVVFMDADGQHDPKYIDELLAAIEEGYDLVVGSRRNEDQAGIHRLLANLTYNKLASWMVGSQIDDLTSGFRAFRRAKLLDILYLLPNRFSYPTTSTIAFFRLGHFVRYIPISVNKRHGKSHIRIYRDGMRFLMIILKVGTLYSPMRFFLPIAASMFVAASSYYLFTYFSQGRFTNMGLLLYVASLFTFMLGVISEQISALHFKDAARPVNQTTDTAEPRAETHRDADNTFDKAA